MPAEIGSSCDELLRYGALESQLVDLHREDEPRILNYLDLRIGGDQWHAPTVVETHGRPCVHVFDGRGGVSQAQVRLWCRRIALRGDGAWVGVLEPGQLRVFRTNVANGIIRPVEEAAARPGHYALPRFLNDVSSGQDDLARRHYLTKLLHGSAKIAMAQGLSQLDALSLVGRGLFWRFLIDRKLLNGLTPPDVCETAKTWAQCLDNKTRALLTFRWLDDTFNGSLLPFEVAPREFPAEAFSATLGNIAHGATESGQLRLPTDWREVNFAHIPVGLLSEVYQAFTHTINSTDAAAKSIYYTPSHIADFLVGQALLQLPDDSRPTLLDPAAGAGVFLVVALRKLVEREWRLTGVRPHRARIRTILNRQLTGMDIDSRALRLAELALYLTALELDPNPKPLKALRFDALRDAVLLDLSKHGPDGSLDAVNPRLRHRFDIVIGNPPWSAPPVGGADKGSWVVNSRDIVRERLGKETAAKFDFPDTNPDLPFVWRALEWARLGGRIALVMHARWLFGQSPRAVRARNHLLQAVRVTGILNGAALRLTRVWPGIQAPWCVLFATNEAPTSSSSDDYAFQFVNLPLDSESDKKQTRIRIDWFDANAISAQEVIECPWTLKTRFRGNRLAARVLRAMQTKGMSLQAYLQNLGDIDFQNGYQVGGKARQEKQRSSAHLIGYPDTKNSTSLGLVIDTSTLPTFSRKTLLSPRNPTIYRAPLLLVTQKIPADRLAVRASRSDVDLAYHESFHGLSFWGVKNAELHVRYLQLWLQSSVMVFCALMMDGRYGVERDVIFQETLRLMPIVPVSQLSKSNRDRLIQLSGGIGSSLTPKQADEIDEFIFDTFDLSEPDRDAIQDTLRTAAPSTESKRNAARAPSIGERQRFLATLRSSMEHVLSAASAQVGIRERHDLQLPPWRLIDVLVSKDGVWPETTVPMQDFLTEANTEGASLVLVRISQSLWRIGLLDRYQWWTPTRARLLATDLIEQQPSA